MNFINQTPARTWREAHGRVFSRRSTQMKSIFCHHRTLKICVQVWAMYHKNPFLSFFEEYHKYAAVKLLDLLGDTSSVDEGRLIAISLWIRNQGKCSFIFFSNQHYFHSQTISRLEIARMDCFGYFLPTYGMMSTLKYQLANRTSIWKETIKTQCFYLVLVAAHRMAVENIQLSAKLCGVWYHLIKSHISVFLRGEPRYVQVCQAMVRGYYGYGISYFCKQKRFVG